MNVTARELIGMILGWIALIVGAWFAAYSLMAYSLFSVWPWNWTFEQRVYHLLIQAAIIALYAILTRPRTGAAE